MKLPIFIILSLLTISSQAFRPRTRFADQVRSIETPQILDTFSLSWQGDLGLSQVVGGVSKIVEGFASFLDLKFIRHCVDVVVDWWYPSDIPAQLESEIAPLLTYRTDDVTAHLQYQLEDQDPQIKQALVTLKAKEYATTGATTLIGAMLNKQKCYERSACILGKYLSDFSGKDLTLMLAEKSLPESWTGTMEIIKKSANKNDFKCGESYVCDHTVDGRSL